MKPQTREGIRYGMEYLNREYYEMRKWRERKRCIPSFNPLKWASQTTLASSITSRGCKSLLEVGAGGSLVPGLFANMGTMSVAVDNEETGVAYSRILGQELANGKVNIVKACGFRLPFPDSSFDYVLSVGLIEHFDKDEQCLFVDELFRCARYFVHVEIPNYDPLSCFYRLYRKHANWHRHCDLSGLRKSQPVVLDGRGVLDTSLHLKQNPMHEKFILQTMPHLYKQSFSIDDIPAIQRAEKGLTTDQRIRHGFTNYVIWELPCD